MSLAPSLVLWASIALLEVESNSQVTLIGDAAFLGAVTVVVPNDWKAPQIF